MHLLGVETVILTNAAGAVNKDFVPGDIMIINDQIKLNGPSPVRGKNLEEFGPRFFDMSYRYDRDYIKLAKEVGKNSNIKLQEGVYFYMPGPQFETPAEIRAIRVLGGKMKRKLVLALAVIMLLSVFTACGTKENGSADKGGDGEKVKVALLCDTAGTQVYILSMINALKDNEEKYGYKAVIAESADTAAYEDNARALIEEGVDFIIGGNWQAGDSMNMLATEFPDAASYVLIDSEIEAENVKCISFREQEGAYLIGMMGAMVTDPEDNIFGSIHVNQGAGSWKWRYGIMERVKRIKPEAEFIFNYVGNYNDPAKAKEFAIQHYEQGAKFINAAAAGGDKEVFEAAKEREFYTSGQDVDLTTPDNPYIVSCQIKDTYATVEYLLEQYFGGDWNTDNEEWGISEGAIGAVHVTHESENPVTDRLTEEDLALLKEVANDIKEGNLDLINMPTEENYK